jgi:hypothetical protein
MLSWRGARAPLSSAGERGSAFQVPVLLIFFISEASRWKGSVSKSATVIVVLKNFRNYISGWYRTYFLGKSL